MGTERTDALRHSSELLGNSDGKQRLRSLYATVVISHSSAQQEARLHLTDWN